jgi:hypothetical protein
MGSLIDLTGKTFGRLTVLSKADKRSKYVFWNCKCSCGKEVIVRGDALRHKNTQSCGCLAEEKRLNSYIDLTGKTFGKWKVLKTTGYHEQPSGALQRTWLCQCECGTIKEVMGQNLRRGLSLSCGCQKHSHIEEKISSLLKEWNISFIPQYKVLIGTTNRYFDFALYKEEKLTFLLEYDGKQHFEDTPYFNSSLELVQRRDKEKEDWAKENNIPLKRISYKEVNLLEEKLRSFLIDFNYEI